MGGAGSGMAAGAATSHEEWKASSDGDLISSSKWCHLSHYVFVISIRCTWTFDVQNWNSKVQNTHFSGRFQNGKVLFNFGPYLQAINNALEENASRELAVQDKVEYNEGWKRNDCLDKSLMNQLCSNDALEALNNAHESFQTSSSPTLARNNTGEINFKSNRISVHNFDDRISQKTPADPNGAQSYIFMDTGMMLDADIETTSTSRQGQSSCDEVKRHGIFQSILRKSGEVQKTVGFNNRHELCACLSEDLQVAMKERNTALQQLSEEHKRWKETASALATAQAENETLKRQAELARQQAAEARSKFNELLDSVSGIQKKLEKEIQLRNDAEIALRHEMLSKQKLSALLQRCWRNYREYSFEELQRATNNFSEDQKLGEGSYGGVYRGLVNDMKIAVKVLKQASIDGQEQFKHEVEILSRIQHPHMVVLHGSCKERSCLVYEYMGNGSLEERLMCKGNTSPLPWYVRFRVCAVATALMFLHNNSPSPIIHRDLKPGNILLDHNFVSKISDVGLARWIPNNLTFNLTCYRDTCPAGTFPYIDPEYIRTGSFGPHSDIFALGIIILQVLTGKPPVGVVQFVEEALSKDSLSDVLDRSAGNWPPSETLKMAQIALKCAEPRRKNRPSLTTEVFIVLQKLSKAAQEVVLSEAKQWHNPDQISGFFVCPLCQEVMEDPHIAADGFTYEYNAIHSWLISHKTSPMTNMLFPHKNLQRDARLYSEISEWKAQARLV